MTGHRGNFYGKEAPLRELTVNFPVFFRSGRAKFEISAEAPATSSEPKF